MKHRILHPGLLLPLFLTMTAIIFAQDLPADRGLPEIRHLDLTYSFAGYSKREEWLARADRLKKQILVSVVLWRMLVKPPITATFFGLVDRGDHTIKKFYFKSHPGFYVTATLYPPKNKKDRAPAVLCPHGHWTYGRL